MNRAFSPQLSWCPRTWGYAPGWYEAGPLALYRHRTMFKNAT